MAVSYLQSRRSFREVVPGNALAPGSVPRSVAGKLRDVVSVKDFGAVGDGATDDTAGIQALLRWASANGKRAYFPAGDYLTDTIYLNSADDPLYLANGRICITGDGPSAYTGTEQGGGTRFIHKDGSAAPLISFIGADLSGAIRNVRLENLTLIGGDQTTDLVKGELCSDLLSIQHCWLRSRAAATNGINLDQCWLVDLRQIRAFGTADGAGTGATGTGLILTSTGYTTNQAIIANVDLYKWGTGRQIGERYTAGSGVVGPVIIIGGQSSNCDDIGTYVGRGVRSLTAIGTHDERAQGPGLVITNLARNVRWQDCTTEGNGQDGSSFNIEVGTTTHGTSETAAVENVEIDGYYGFNVVNGIKLSVGDSIGNVHLDRIVMEPSVVESASAGLVGISVPSTINYNTKLRRGKQINLQPGAYAFATPVDDTNSQLAREVPATRVQILTAGETTLDATNVTRVRFNNGSATNFTQFTNGYNGQQITVSFANGNTTLVHGGSTIALSGGVNYTGASGKRVVLECIAGIFQEIVR